MPGRTEAGAASTAASALANSPRARAHLVGDQRAQLGRGRRGRAKSASATPKRSRSSARQVDAVEPPVLAHVADEVRVLEGEPEPAEAGVVALGHAEQRRHDAPDGARRALHVGDELVPGLDPHRRAVEPHRAHVGSQLAERQAVAAAGVDERADHGLARAPGGEPGLELGLPGVERGAARLGPAGAARAVDDLVGRADVAVERVRRRADLLRQPPRGPVIRRVVAPVHAPAGLVGAAQRRIDRLSRHPLRQHDGRAARQDLSTSPARAAWARRPSPPRSAWRPLRRAGARSSARSPSRSACRARSRARASSARPRWSSPRTCGRSRSTPTWRSRSGSPSSSAAARRCACWRAPRRSSTSSPPRRERSEMITIAKVCELAQLERWDRRHRTYDLVIVDAPASGHGLAMLSTPKTFGEIARVGPIKRQAEKIRPMLGDADRTGYLAVALAEEMPVNETLELGDEARGGGRARARRGRRQRRSTPSATRRPRPRCCAAPPQRPRSPRRSTAVRAALAEHERSSAQQRPRAAAARRGRRAGARRCRCCSSPRSASSSTAACRLPRVGARAADRGLTRPRRAARACRPRA